MNPSNNNVTFNAAPGMAIMTEGSSQPSLKLLLQGRLEAYIAPYPGASEPAGISDNRHAGYKILDIDQNVFIGANDMFTGSNASLTYIAATDCTLFSCPVRNRQETEELIQRQKDYGAYINSSLCSLILDAYRTLDGIRSYCHTEESVLGNLCAFYVSLADAYQLSRLPGTISETGAKALSLFDQNGISVPLQFSRSFIGPSGKETVLAQIAEQNSEIEYYTHLYGIPADIRKSFFSADSCVAGRHAAEASLYLEKLLKELKQAFGRFEEIFSLLYSTEADNLYGAFMKAAFELKEKGLDHTPALDAASYTLDRIRSISSHIENSYKHNMGVDFEYLDHIHNDRSTALKLSVSAQSGTAPVYAADSMQSLPVELVNSTVKILEYAEIPDEQASSFMTDLNNFRNLKDRLSLDEKARSVRKAVADQFFNIYSKVFKKAHESKDESRLIRMFLSFGYMDEKLLDPGQTMAIYRLAGMDHSCSGINVYFMHQWLGEIYDMSKDPSVNSFGNDYADTFRELRKQGRLAESDKAAYMNDRDGRLDFEINNMLKTNHRLCQGQISQYFPILHRDAAPHDPMRSFLSPAVINEKLTAILEIDYSLFHREIHYINPEKGIEKEIIMSKVMPDIILMPVYGTRAMMWQEITGRLRNSPGRFILPVFTDENISDMILKLAGNFRWELCRTMMGAAWNDITQSSLTSEYADYIQFYRKNRDLTEEAKEKVKSLISKHQNKLRDIFTSEYEIWISNESKGNPRLNRVARSIFTKHCPFSKEIRQSLARQPIYSDLISAFNMQRAKKVRELENRYKAYTKSGSPLDPDLRENLDFYKNL